MKRIRVPEFLKAAIRNSARFLYTGNPALCDEQVEAVAKAVCVALMEHPQVPTDEQAEKLRKDFIAIPFEKAEYACKWIAVEWQRRCFVQEEPEIPEEIKDLLQVELTTIDPQPHSTVLDPKTTKLDCTVRQWNEVVLEAYRRGLRKGEQK